jgi:hypothetical protein
MKKPLLFIVVLFAMTLKPLLAQYYGTEEEVTKPFSIGLKIGSSALWGEVEPDPTKSYEVGISLQQVLSRTFDFRLQFHHGQARGLGRSPGEGLMRNKAWNGECTCGLSSSGECPCGFAPDYFDTTMVIPAPFYNNQTQYFDGSAQLKLNLNRLFLKNAERWDFYVYGSLGAFLFQTKVDALDGNGNEYDFSGIPSDDAQTVSALRALLDGEFETQAEQDFFSNSKVGDYALLITWGGGAGVRFRLGEKFALGLEARYLDTNEYLTDGVQWNAQNMITGTTDKLLSGALTVEVILKKKEKF